MEFRKELETLINKHSIENDSDTPDFILANYIKRTLETFGVAVNARDKWYGLKPFKIDPLEAVKETKE